MCQHGAAFFYARTPATNESYTIIMFNVTGTSQNVEFSRDSTALCGIIRRSLDFKKRIAVFRAASRLA